MLLALGFTGSAFGLYAALWLVGATVLGDARSTTGGWLLAAGMLGLLLGLDSQRARRPGATGPLSWAALAVTFFGVVLWWSGLAYALGFTVPMLAMILAVPKHTDPTGETDPEPVWLVDKIMDSRSALKVAALLMMGGAVMSCLALAVHA
jgi:hypothetical protein